MNGRIRVRVDLFRQILKEQERLRRIALTSQVLSVLACLMSLATLVLMLQGQGG